MSILKIIMMFKRDKKFILLRKHFSFFNTRNKNASKKLEIQHQEALVIAAV